MPYAEPGAYCALRFGSSALKELQLEEKLTVISEEWADCQLAFTNFKSRGPIHLSRGGMNLRALRHKLPQLQTMLSERAHACPGPRCLRPTPHGPHPASHAHNPTHLQRGAELLLCARARQCANVAGRRAAQL